jgi:ferritin
MKLSQELNDAINSQIQHELLNQNKYLQIASYFANLQLMNLSNYFTKQADHEFSHAKLFIDHLNARIGGKVLIESVEAPNLTISSIEDVGNIYVETEQGTTEAIEDLYNFAMESKSFIDLPFLSKMLDEQIEEEDSAQSFKLKSSMVKDIVLFDATFEK